MNWTVFVIRASSLLFLALGWPVALPAGGGQMSCPYICQRRASEPIVISDDLFLKTAHFSAAQTLFRVKGGVPLRPIRSFHDLDGQEWIQVETSFISSNDLFVSAVRGWLNV